MLYVRYLKLNDSKPYDYFHAISLEKNNLHSSKKNGNWKKNNSRA